MQFHYEEIKSKCNLQKFANELLQKNERKETTKDYNVSGWRQRISV